MLSFIVSFHLLNRFGCREFCDCYRDSNFSKLGPVAKENRHFFEETFNITVHYFQWFPPSIPFMLKDIPQTPSLSLCADTIGYIEKLNSSYNLDSTYIYNDVLDFLRAVIQPLRPDFLIMNQGHWKLESLRSNNSYMSEFVSLAKKSSKHFVWKTTTARCFGTPDDGVDGPKFLADLNRNHVAIFDAFHISLGAAIHHSIEKPVCTYDKHHYMPFVYRELNKKLFEYLISREWTGG